MKKLFSIALFCCVVLNSTQLLVLLGNKNFNSKHILYVKSADNSVTKILYCKK